MIEYMINQQSTFLLIMYKAIPLLVILVLSLYGLKQFSQTGESNEFDLWKTSNAVTFKTTSEEAYRKIIFEANLLTINKHNNDPSHTYKMGVNQFTIHTEFEFAQLFLSSKMNIIPNIQSQTTEQYNAVIIDWTQKGAVTSVKTQGTCGGSTVYSNIGGMEGLNFILTGTLQTYSQQQLIDCVYGCTDDNLLNKGYIYYEVRGACTSKQYPYTGKADLCKNTNCPFKISKSISVNGCSGLTNALTRGPVSVYADAAKWPYYASGIFRNCQNTLNHVVLLTGMADEYWKVKNSWGATWGEQGYIRLAPGNTCGICTSGEYPIK